MDIVVVGINHKTAPIEIREQFHLRAIEQELLLAELRNSPSIAEALILSTCNRTEIYARAIDADPSSLLRIFCQIKNLNYDKVIRDYFYSYRDRAAVEHLLKVSAGLDSLILGEKQILGQLKDAAELSRKKTMLSTTFNILSNVAIRTGKKARTETQIDAGGSSISWAAVSCAQKMLGDLDGKSVLIIGAGKMGQLALRHLREKNVKDIYVTNRTCQNAVSLADAYGAIAVSLLDLKDVLEKVDVCVCSASAPHYILEADMVRKIMSSRRERKLLLIDISMPRNIHPAVSRLQNVSLLAIDDLDKVITESLNSRQSSVSAVEEIISKKVEEFYRKLESSAERSLSFVSHS